MLLKDYLKENYPEVKYSKAVQKYENCEVINQNEFHSCGRDQISNIYIDAILQYKDFEDGKPVIKNKNKIIDVNKTKTGKIRITTIY